MTASTFDPRRRLTIHQARRLARSIQSPADVKAQLADMRAREEAAREKIARETPPADRLVRSPNRRASSWFAPMAMIAVLALVAMGYVAAVVPR